MLQVGFCQHHNDDSVGMSVNELMLQSSHEKLAKVFDSSERDDWQKPDESSHYHHGQKKVC